MTEPAARDLVKLTNPPVGGRLLDIGTGTGIAAEVARKRLGSDGLVVGVDISFDMLAVGTRKRREIHFVAGDALHLPFHHEIFDVVIANFVIGLVQDYKGVLMNMSRCLRAGGRIALTWSGNAEDEFHTTWLQLCEEAVGQQMLNEAVANLVPGDLLFADHDSFGATLRDVGLHSVRVETRAYQVQIPREDYLLHRATSPSGRFVHSMVGEEGWIRFMKRAQSRFPAEIKDVGEVLIAIGTKGPRETKLSQVVDPDL